MNLDEAIKRYYRLSDRRCRDIGLEYAQILAWLKELKEYRNVEANRNDKRRTC